MYTNTCPTCGEPAIGICMCQLKDSVCKNGHHWFYCPQHAMKVKGDPPDHPTYTLRCLCPADELRKSKIFDFMQEEL